MNKRFQVQPISTDWNIWYNFLYSYNPHNIFEKSLEERLIAFNGKMGYDKSQKSFTLGSNLPHQKI
jgi:hypothetical protein